MNTLRFPVTSLITSPRSFAFTSLITSPRSFAFTSLITSPRSFPVAAEAPVPVLAASRLNTFLDLGEERAGSPPPWVGIGEPFVTDPKLARRVS